MLSEEAMQWYMEQADKEALELEPEEACGCLPCGPEQDQEDVTD